MPRPVELIVDLFSLCFCMPNFPLPPLFLCSGHRSASSQRTGVSSETCARAHLITTHALQPNHGTVKCHKLAPPYESGQRAGVGAAIAFRATQRVSARTSKQLHVASDQLVRELLSDVGARRCEVANNVQARRRDSLPLLFAAPYPRILHPCYRVLGAIGFTATFDWKHLHCNNPCPVAKAAAHNASTFRRALCRSAFVRSMGKRHFCTVASLALALWWVVGAPAFAVNLFTRCLPRLGTCAFVGWASLSRVRCVRCRCGKNSLSKRACCWERRG
ncbi:hypothetical protein ERJ75_001577600 [Trypanosoma vivax]|nr:hypothetical protein ERJ75_001577600 [Trypanosoma vivax]